MQPNHHYLIVSSSSSLPSEDQCSGDYKDMGKLLPLQEQSSNNDKVSLIIITMSHSWLPF